MVNKIIIFFKNLNERQILLLLIGTAFILRLYAVLMAQGIAYGSAAYGFMARDFIRDNDIFLVFLDKIFIMVIIVQEMNNKIRVVIHAGSFNIVQTFGKHARPAIIGGD
jgi:hypothetical protein